jgi:protocatechuate 3,4-dioxygenase beta subunit
MSNDHDDFGGLQRDLKMLSRRRLFGLLGGAAAAGITLIPVLGACTDPGESSADAGTGSGTDGGTGTDSGGSGCPSGAVPSETAGPYPGDGTNGANALALSGIVRADLRASVSPASGTAPGIPLTVALTIVDAGSCSPLVGYAVYIWHCDRDGNYSMYTGAATSENYLRGVQVTDANGQVSFTSIFPACYAGRWPHIHFEIYASVAAATSGNNKVAVSQLAMPKAACDAVYATTGYAQSVSNLSQVSLATDMVFSDGATLEIPTMTGSVAAGYTAALTAAINA